jgi:uncharacterized membrane protein
MTPITVSGGIGCLAANLGLGSVVSILGSQGLVLVLVVVLVLVKREWSDGAVEWRSDGAVEWRSDGAVE